MDRDQLKFIWVADDIKQVSVLLAQHARSDKFIPIYAPKRLHYLVSLHDSLGHKVAAKTLATTYYTGGVYLVDRVCDKINNKINNNLML